MFLIPATAKSWVEVPAGHDFPIQNLPYGRFSVGQGPVSIGVRIGDFVLDLHALSEKGLIPRVGDEDVVTLPQAQLRQALFELLEVSNPRLRDDSALLAEALIPLSEVTLHRPVKKIGAYVDFYSGIHHASNMGKMYRPDQPALLPNYRHLPVAYNSRASSVVVSGTPVKRPNGQTKKPDAAAPEFGPTRELDCELEVGFFTCGSTNLGETIPMSKVGEYIFGLVLVNDWSARDVQRWEYVPLGPFLAKTFATSISPWIVTLDALEPFRCEGPVQDPEPLPYLKCDQPWHWDIQLEVSLQTEKMSAPQVISRTNYRELYWNIAQHLVHQASNGTNIESGDFYASGTISGPEPGTFGSVLELTWKGENALLMEETGEQRRFIENGDTLTIKGWCEKDGLRIGFGEVSGKVVG